MAHAGRGDLDEHFVPDRLGHVDFFDGERLPHSPAVRLLSSDLSRHLPCPKGLPDARAAMMAQCARIGKPSPDRERSSEARSAEPDGRFGPRRPATNVDGADGPKRRHVPSGVLSKRRRSACMLRSADPSRYEPDRRHGMVAKTCHGQVPRPRGRAGNFGGVRARGASPPVIPAQAEAPASAGGRIHPSRNGRGTSVHAAGRRMRLFDD